MHPNWIFDVILTVYTVVFGKYLDDLTVWRQLHNCGSFFDPKPIIGTNFAVGSH